MSSSSGLLLFWRTARRSSAPRAVDGALDLEQSVEASDRLQRDRRDRFAPVAFPGVLLDVCQLEEAPPRMGEAKRRRNRQHLLLRIEQRLEAVVAISLQDTGEGGQLLLWMLASTVARGVIDRRRWRWPGEGPVIPHICPDPTGLALALGQDADGGVVAMPGARQQAHGVRSSGRAASRRRSRGRPGRPASTMAGPIPSALKRALWRLSGMCMPNLSNRIVVSNCGPMKPRGCDHLRPRIVIALLLGLPLAS
ncbi:hypothetical protein ACVWXQ_000124 [Bradyrhizobium sp. S3.14.4]